MNFIVTSTALLKHLQSVGGALNTSNTLPILDNFLFEINKEELTISASDLETTMKTKMEIKSESEGKIAVPAKLLLDILKNFPEQPLTFTIEDNLSIEIASDYGKYKLVGEDANEYPKTPIVENPSTVKLPGEVITNAINKTIFATGNDELRPVMNGVFCEFTGEGLTFVATDAHKLVRYRRKDFTSDSNSTFILPKKPLNLLKNHINDEAEVTLEFNESNAKFQFENIEMTCRLIDGKYPNYEAVIPVENPNKLTVTRNIFSSSIKRVSIFANKSTHQVQLKMAGTELTISAEDLDFSNEANERLTCSYEGEDMEIGFNSRFLLEMLNNIDASDIVIEMSAPNRAGIILPSEVKNPDEEILMLIMPVMISR